MYITLDFECPGCGFTEERFVKKSARAEQRCPNCVIPMRDLPAGPITTFKFGDRAAIKSKKAVSFR